MLNLIDSPVRHSGRPVAVQPKSIATQPVATSHRPATDRLQFGTSGSNAAPVASAQALSAPTVTNPRVQAYLKSFPTFGPPAFNAEFHAERRRTFLSLLPPDTTVIVPGNGLKRRNGDVDYTFRQDSNFYYLTGFDEPDAVAVLSNEPGKPSFTLIVPPRDPAKETWTGKRAGTQGAKETYRADVAHANTQLGNVLQTVFRTHQNVQVLPTVADPDVNRRIRQDMRQALPVWPRIKLMAATLLQQVLNRLKIDVHVLPTHQEANDALNQMRLIKTPYEIALLKRACDISATGHLKAMKHLRLKHARGFRKLGRNEGEIQAEMEYHFRRHGAVRVGYDTIAGGGANGCVLHYNTNKEFARPGDLALVDAGAEYGYYTADVTRTWPISGTFSAPQRAIYDLVLKAQETGIRMTRPGVSMGQIHRENARIITEGLVELGILKGDPQKLLEQGAYRKYFMHGTSHMLGLDVHDVPYGTQNIHGVPLRNGNIQQQPLRPGMVFTIEPGIYIDPAVARKEGLDPRWWGIGVRIEDDILVTQTGYENLSQNVPRQADDIEALMNGASRTQ